MPKAIGATTGAVSRSPGRIQSAVSTHTGRNSTPYAVNEPPNSTRSRNPSTSIAAPANSPPPSPVSRGLGSRRAAGRTAGRAAPPGLDGPGRRAPGPRPRTPGATAGRRPPRGGSGAPRRGPYRADGVLCCSTGPT